MTRCLILQVLPGWDRRGELRSPGPPAFWLLSPCAVFHTNVPHCAVPQRNAVQAAHCWTAVTAGNVNSSGSGPRAGWPCRDSNRIAQTGLVGGAPPGPAERPRKTVGQHVNRRGLFETRCNLPTALVGW
ncbi:MAG: hypothetical protein CMJ75_17525 [Planctomycetaceae bacterium]|nr:hypothetical protein [Planctomycetaceae bacterium]